MTSRALTFKLQPRTFLLSSDIAQWVGTGIAARFEHESFPFAPAMSLRPRLSSASLGLLQREPLANERAYRADSWAPPAASQDETGATVCSFAARTCRSNVWVVMVVLSSGAPLEAPA